MSLEAYIEEFETFYHARAENYVHQCDAVLSKITELRDPASIGLLSGLLDDHAEYDELMFSIVHSMEIFEDEIYIDHLLDASYDLCITSPRWASIVFMRVLNAAPARRLLTLKLRNAPQRTKSAIRELMEKINDRDLVFLEKTIPIIFAASH